MSIGAPAPADGAARSCRPPGGKVLLSSSEGTVYKAGKTRATRRYVACRGRRTKPLVLGGADCFNAEAPSQFVISGRWLGYVSTSCDTVSGSDTVVVVDLRTLTRRYEGAASATPAARADPYAGVERIAVAPSGAIAWVASFVSGDAKVRTYEVRRSGALRDESVLLDAGADVAPDSLAVGSNLVYWMRAGTPRVAPLSGSGGR